jgi:glycosyltransferase involved in cell wall biosynthesis
MRILLVSDAFPPLRTSAAVHMFDLAWELSRHGHEVVVITPVPNLEQRCIESVENFGTLLSVRVPKTKDIGYFRRTVGEFLQPFIMFSAFKSSSVSQFSLDGIVWYSPSIFFGPLIKRLKARYRCRSYLILRDLFPDWAVDLGVLNKGLAYRFLKLIEHNQYDAADKIGVQCPANMDLISGGAQIRYKCEVLWTWLGGPPQSAKKCSIQVAETQLHGRSIFVYAGNMGVAQGMDMFIELAACLLAHQDVGFMFVGRGSDVQHLKAVASKKGLNNVMFFDEIDPSEISGLYEQCHIGLVALDPRHKTHNIPGKFLSYMKAGLPVLASVNPGNDLIELIQDYQVGYVCTESSIELMLENALLLLSGLDQKENYAVRCGTMTDRLFSPDVAIDQIIAGLKE